MATVQITAPTPMMMPSMVRTVRSLLRAKARSATRMISLGFIFRSFRASSRASRRSIAAESWRTLAGRSLRRRGGGDHQRVTFANRTGDQLVIFFFVAQLPHNLPAAEVRGRSGARNVVLLVKILKVLRGNRRLECQRRVRNFQRVFRVTRGNRHVGRFARQQL